MIAPNFQAYFPSFDAILQCVKLNKVRSINVECMITMGKPPTEGTRSRRDRVPEVGGFPLIITFSPDFRLQKRPPRPPSLPCAERWQCKIFTAHAKVLCRLAIAKKRGKMNFGRFIAFRQTTEPRKRFVRGCEIFLPGPAYLFCLAVD